MRIVADRFTEALHACATNAPAEIASSLHYLASGLMDLLEKAQLELKHDREAAKASLVAVSSILRSEIERSSGGWSGGYDR
jgi:CRISPR/Cas system-associated protein Csm6